MDILKAVLDIEYKARKILAETDELKKLEAENTKKALLMLENNAKAELNARLLKISENINDKQSFEAEEDLKLFQTRLSDMEKYFAENKAYWTETILRNITGGEMV